ncbi:hypothetical protein NIES4103_01050 [Nostoc sp. NIES-4103]|nr:hypothetical protein NIES4103_01050 [Nostoc sp. NIES-4103]
MLVDKTVEAIIETQNLLLSHNLVDPKTIDNNIHAVVIGSGIAGLLAARVLTNHFAKVTIIERDYLSSQSEPRRGVPQSQQPHLLLTRGQIILEQLFPGIKDELATHEATLIDWTADFKWLLPGGWNPGFSSGITSRTCTRNLLETVIRQRLFSNKKVEFLEGTTVINLLTDTTQSFVKGVCLRDSKGVEVNLNTQLVVDASGRKSHAIKWLKNLGYEVPQETKINSFLGYASRLYQVSDDSYLDYKALYIMPKAPTNPRGAVLYRVESNRFLVNLIGVGRDYPPTDEDGFLNFAQSLRSPQIYEAIKNALPLSPINGYQGTDNCWRHYERLPKFLENFIVLGDAVCAFNPVYAQGMTVAALGALTLDECLKKHKRFSGNGNISLGLSRRFQKQLAKVNAEPWLASTGYDLRWPKTEGGKASFVTRLMQRYMDQIMIVAVKNAFVYKLLIEVIHLLKPPTVFFQPAILTQVLKLQVQRLYCRS